MACEAAAGEAHDVTPQQRQAMLHALKAMDLVTDTDDPRLQPLSSELADSYDVLVIIMVIMVIIKNNLRLRPLSSQNRQSDH